MRALTTLAMLAPLMPDAGITKALQKMNSYKPVEHDTCSTCWHMQKTNFKCLSKTGVFCEKTKKEINMHDLPCEHFKLAKYFQRPEGCLKY